jgi:hypothetical protein
MSDSITPEAPPQEATARLASLEPADVTLAAPGCLTLDAVGAAIAAARDVVQHLLPGLRVVLVYPEAVVGDPAIDLGGASVQAIPWRLSATSRPSLATGDGREAFLPLSTVGTQVSARACALVGAHPDAVSPETISRLVRPVLDGQADVLLPCYPRHRLEGLINTGIVYPLMRSLYGRQADGQLGVDFGLSPRMVAALVQPAPRTSRGGPVWLLPEAVERGFTVGQAYLPTWLPPAEESADVSSSLTQVLGSLFTDLELHATTWQRVRGSRPVPGFGEPATVADERRPVDVRSMVESFQLGFRNLQEVWARVLPPATVVALGRLARAPADQFRMPDDLWARIIFDVALGFRLRTINRDHLLRAMTPVYLGWAASYARDVSEADRASVRQRLEDLCLAYESQKPYLLARWRWPDRFAP